MEGFRRTVLEDGLEVVSTHHVGARSVSLGAWLDVGSRDEAPTQAGLAHFMEHLVFKGTRGHSALDIAQMFDAVGGDLNAFTTKEATCFHVRVLERDLAMSVGVLAELIQRPLLDPDDVEVERRVVLEEISMHEDTPEDLVGDLLMEAMYPDQAIGRRIQGFSETIEVVSQQQVEAFHQANYSSVRAVIAASGSVDHDRLVALVLSEFSTSGPRRGLRDEGGSDARTGVKVIASRDIEQAHLVLAVPGVSRRDKRRFAMALLNAALGGGMSSRLFQQIREERGLVYNVGSGNQGLVGTGVFSIYAGCAPERAAEVAALAGEIVREVCANGITEAELERARGFLTGGMLMGFEDSGGLMSHIGKSALFYGDVLSPDELVAEIEKVSLEDCLALGREVLGSNRWSLALIGPEGTPQVHAFDLPEAAA